MKLEEVEARPRPRPRFELRVDATPEVILARVAQALKQSTTKTIRGLVLAEGRIELRVSDKERRLWSPQLTVDVRPEGDGAHLRARFGPDPHVWTMYVTLYAASVVFATACGVWGMAQMILHRTPWALYLAPLAAVFAGLVYGASFVGQGLGSEQMYRVRAFLEEALADDAKDAATPEDPQG